VSDERQDDALLSETISAGLLREWAGDPELFLKLLVQTLETVAPERVTVSRSGGWFGRGALRRLEIDLDGERYRLRVGKGGALTAERVSVVRGIALKTDTVTVAEWLRGLSSALVAYGETHQAALEALKRHTWE
jgi:hypothetical protein